MTDVQAWIIVCCAAFGAVIGSFLNVVIHRLPRQGESIIRPGSRCVRCGSPIAWYDNLPILSWLLLRGRCRDCKVAISARYPLVEALSAGLTVLLAVQLLFPALVDPDPVALWYPALPRFLVSLGLLYAMVASTFIDLDHTIIPNEITKPGMVLAVVASVIVPRLHGMTSPVDGALWSLLGVATGVGFIWLVRILGRLVFRKEAMGLGDVKYMGMIGGFLGWKGVLLVFFLACISGSVIGVFVLLLRKSRYIPFAPFLSLGAVVILLYGDRVLRFLREDYPELIRGLISG